MIVFNLNFDVRLTKGVNRSIIFDFRKELFFFIPNSMFDFVSNHSGKNLDFIFSQFETQDKLIVREYVDWMLRAELATLLKDEDLFAVSNVKSHWHMPYVFTNAIVEVNSGNETTLNNSIACLSKYRVPYLELRVDASVSIELLSELTKDLQFSCFKGINIYVEFSKSFSPKNVKKYFKNFTVLNLMVVHSAPSDFSFEIQNELTTISFIKDRIDSSSCGTISEKYFTINRLFFDETQEFNNCLNRKIAIQSNGDIKNCPSLKDIFGNINTIDISDLTRNQSFTKLWGISKTHIDTCKECEFRDICSDCRAYLSDPNNIGSKPLKCGYDPKTNIWSDWKDIPNNLKAIRHYALHNI